MPPPRHGAAVSPDRTWFCRYCTHERTGDRFFNKPDREVCYQCRRSKGACFHSYKEPKSPSVRVGDSSKAPWHLAKEQLQQAQDTIKRLEHQLKDKRDKSPALDAMEVEVNDHSTGRPAAEGEFNEGKYSAKVAELEKHIDMASKCEGGAWATLKAALVEERDSIQADINNRKPAAAKMLNLTRKIEAMGTQIGKQEKAIEDKRMQITEMQNELDEAEKAVAEKKIKLEELRAQAMEVAQASVKPPGSDGDNQGGQVAAIGLDATMLGKVLRELGAGDHADRMVEGIAHALPNIIANAKVTVVGKADGAVNAAATLAAHEAAEAARAQGCQTG